MPIKADGKDILYKYFVHAEAFKFSAQAETESIKVTEKVQAGTASFCGLANVKVLLGRNLTWQKSYVPISFTKSPQLCVLFLPHCDVLTAPAFLPSPNQFQRRRADREGHRDAALRGARHLRAARQDRHNDLHWQL